MININYTNHWGNDKINSTILQSIIDTFGKLRYQAQDNPKAFRAILELVIMQDIMDWAASIINSEEELVALLTLIIKKQQQLILCNPDISIQYIDSSNAYTNVNTDQTYYDWTRVWDRDDVTMVSDLFTPCDDKGCTNPSLLLREVTNIIIDNDILDNRIIDKDILN